MPSQSQKTNQPDVAETFLGLLVDRGIDLIFGNVGSDFPPIIEALAKAGESRIRNLKPFLVPHENVAMAMAHGFYMSSGRLPAVALHVGQGTANALNGIINASRQNIPVLILAGRTPIIESEVLGGRDNYINWAQEMYDQAGMVREFVKWECELRDSRQLEGILDRAMAIAMSEPRGPVYLTLPREVLAGPMDVEAPPGSASTIQPSRPAQASNEGLEQLSDWLGQARHPLIISSNLGQTAAEASAFKRFVEHFAIPAVLYRPRYMGLSSSHPMHCGYDATAILPETDLIIVADCDVPWIPSLVQPRSSAKIAHIGLDPLFERYPTRGFRADLSIEGETPSALDSLTRLAPLASFETLKNDRLPWIAGHHESCAPPQRSKAPTVPDKITPSWISACIDMAKDADTVIVNEYPLALNEVSFEESETYYSHSPAAGLGWAMGASLGVKLARPDKTVIVTVGDGTYMFGNPTPVHFVSRAADLPVLFIVFNNARYGAVHRATLSMYPDGAAGAMESPPLSCLEPSPDYSVPVQASGGYGEKITDPQALPGAIAKALKMVREERRQVVLNVVCEAIYVRTS